MSGRPVRLLTAAAIAAAASLLSISAASASCYGCGPAVRYAPSVVYQAPVVYSHSYAAPVAYGAGCGCGGYAASAPMYVVNQGPTYTHPVTIEAEPTPAYEYGHRRAYPHYGAGGLRWHRRHWHHRHHGYRHHGYRHGAVMPGFRHGWRARSPMIGSRGIYRGSRFAHVPRARFHMQHRVQRMHMMRTPGMVHPRMLPSMTRPDPMHRLNGGPRRPGKPGQP